MSTPSRVLGLRLGLRLGLGWLLSLGLLAAPMLAQSECESLVGNEVPNCGFETGDPPSDWIVVQGLDFQQDAMAHSGSFAGAIAPAPPVITAPWNTVITSPCFETASDAYEVGAQFRRSAPGRCRAYLNLYLEPACQGTRYPGATDWTDLVVDEWNSAFALVETESLSAELVLNCEAGNDLTTPFLMDDALAVAAPVTAVPALDLMGLVMLTALLGLVGVRCLGAR